MRRLNIATALAFLALSAMVVAGTADLAYWSDFAPGPAFAPVWMAAAGTALALLLLVKEARDPTPEPADLPARAALALALVLAPRLGFVTTVIALTLFVLLVVERRRVLPSLVVTVLTAALIHGVFVAWLNVQLPKGFLGI